MSTDSPEVAALKSLGVQVTAIEGPGFDLDTLIKEGWRYQDFPQMLVPYWDYFKAAFGTEGEDYHILTEANYGNGYARGQLVLSPQALKNLAVYRANHPLPDATPPT